MSDFSNPEHIAISRSKGVKIDWKDGHASEYGLTYLQDKCPCATCTGAHGTPPRQPATASPFQMYQPTLKIVNAEPAGNYALRIAWSDGHDTGIYSWDYLRSICPCPQCRKAGSSPGESAPGASI
jgi:DUF971 family protein